MIAIQTKAFISLKLTQILTSIIQFGLLALTLSGRSKFSVVSDCHGMPANNLGGLLTDLLLGVFVKVLSGKAALLRASLVDAYLSVNECRAALS